MKAEAESSSLVLVHGYLDKDIIAFYRLASGSTILGTQETDEAKNLLSLRQLLGLFGSIQRQRRLGGASPMLWLSHANEFQARTAQ